MGQSRVGQRGHLFGDHVEDVLGEVAVELALFDPVGHNVRGVLVEVILLDLCLLLRLLVLFARKMGLWNTIKSVGRAVIHSARSSMQGIHMERRRQEEEIWRWSEGEDIPTILLQGC